MTGGEPKRGRWLKSDSPEFGFSESGLPESESGNNVDMDKDELTVLLDDIRDTFLAKYAGLYECFYSPLDVCVELQDFLAEYPMPKPGQLRIGGSKNGNSNRKP